MLPRLRQGDAPPHSSIGDLATAQRDLPALLSRHRRLDLPALLPQHSKTGFVSLASSAQDLPALLPRHRWCARRHTASLNRDALLPQLLFIHGKGENGPLFRKRLEPLEGAIVAGCVSRGCWGDESNRSREDPSHLQCHTLGTAKVKLYDRIQIERYLRLIDQVFGCSALWLEVAT